MSSAEATVEDTVGTAMARGSDGTRPATVLALVLIAITQVTWLAALAYGAFWLVTLT